MAKQKLKQTEPVGINLAAKTSEILAECAEVLGKKREDYYRRGQELVQKIPGKELEDGVERDGNSVVIRPADATSITLDLEDSATFVSPSAKGLVEVRPPKSLAGQLMVEAERNKGDYRELDLITATPVLLPDKTVLDTAGYRLGVEFAPSKRFKYDAVPELPTKDFLKFGAEDSEMALWWDAHMAIRKFYPLLALFPFVGVETWQDDLAPIAQSSPSYSVVISAILSLVARPALKTVPLHVFDAPAPGTGKTKCAELAVLAATGVMPAVIAFRDKDELSKSLTPLLRAGDRAVLIDNISSTLYSDEFCAVLTSQVHEARILGESKHLRLRNSAVFLASGNNISVAADMVRRSVKCTLDSGLERPENRKFDVDPVQVAREMHPELCIAALTALRAYVLAGMPRDGEPTLGSFEQWDRLVRGLLLWLGYGDPLWTQEDLRGSDPLREADLSLLMAWFLAYGNTPVTLFEIAKPGMKDGGGSLAELGQDNENKLRLWSEMGGKDWDTVKIGYRLRKIQGRIIGGYRLTKLGHGKQGQLWMVENLDRNGDDGDDRITE